MSKFKIGDRVKVVRKVKCEDGWKNSWVSGMDHLVGDGRVYTVVDVRAAGVYLDNDCFGWPHSSFELAEVSAVPAIKAGDLVRALIDCCDVAAGRVYAVLNVEDDDNIRVADDVGDSWYLHHSAWEKAVTIKVGDKVRMPSPDLFGDFQVGDVFEVTAITGLVAFNDRVGDTRWREFKEVELVPSSTDVTAPAVKAVGFKKGDRVKVVSATFGLALGQIYTVDRIDSDGVWVNASPFGNREWAAPDRFELVTTLEPANDNRAELVACVDKLIEAAEAIKKLIA